MSISYKKKEEDKAGPADENVGLSLLCPIPLSPLGTYLWRILKLTGTY